MVFNINPDYDLFRQPTTYATFLRPEIEQIMSMQGFATLRFFSAKAPGGYDSVLAAGYGANGQILLPTFAPILLDNVPCPPECHFLNTTNAQASPNVWLPLDAAKQMQSPENQFAASFPRAMIEELLDLGDVEKIRVYYAAHNGTQTFLVRRVDGAGNNLPDYYLLDESPVSPAEL